MLFRLYYSLFIFFLIFAFMDYSYSKSMKGKKNNNEKNASMLLNDSIAESDLSKKEKLLRRAYKLDPKDSKIQFTLGKLLYQRKKDKEAKPLLIKAYKDSKLTYRVFTYLADYFYRNNNTKEAVFYLEKLIISFEEGNTYLNNFRLAVLSSKLKQYRRANYFFLRAYNLRKYEDNKEILLNLAQNHFRLQEYKQTLFYLNKYPYTNKYNQAALMLLIKTHYKLNNKKDLNTALKSYISIWPHDNWARKLLSKL